MIFTFSLRHFWKKASLLIVIIILLWIVYVVFPSLIKLFWPQSNNEEKMRQQYLLEKPLRVLYTVMNSS